MVSWTDPFLTSAYFPWGEEVVEEILDPLSPAGGQTTTWSYHTDEADEDNYSRVALMQQSGGYWERYEYDNLGRVIKVVSPVGNAPPGASEADSRVVVTHYQTTIPQETRIETELGQEISRSYTVHQGTSTRRIVAATTGAAWDDPANRVTETVKVGGYGQFKDRSRYIRHSNGTLTHHTYSFDESAQVTTTVTSRGAPNAAQTAVVDGTRTTLETNRFGRVQSEMVEDIASGLLLSLKVLTDSDSLGRPLRFDYADGTFETFTYSCCGLSSHVDREGVVTSYYYDALKRKTHTIRNGITHESVYDASNRVIEEARIGTDASRIIQRQTGFSADGRIAWQKDALGWKQLHSVEPTSGGGERRITTHEADGSTTIYTYLRDGRLESITGTAVAPILYEYGTAAGGLSWTKEIRPATAGVSSEWSRTWRNMLGQTIRTEYPDASEILRSYNAKGQLIAETDPDGVTTLYAYNDRGERTVRALDINRSGVIDYAGGDRIERTTTEVVEVAGQVRRRTTHERWESTGSDTAAVFLIDESAADGSERWQTRNGLTTHTLVTLDGAGERISEITAPDNSRLRQRFVEGQLVKQQHFAGDGELLSQRTYVYDSHGRLQQEVQADIGTTVYSYTAADQIATLTTPDPDPAETSTGMEPQTTHYFYDGRGRVERIQHPDNSETFTSYYPTGLTKRTWGSRTYPVEYAYDLQGRRTAMTTWKDFASDAGAATTAWLYHPERGWMLEKHYPDPTTGNPLAASAVSYTYTAAGRLASRTWARGVVTTYSHNDAGDVDSISYSDSTPAVSYSHDRLGRVHTATDPAGTLTYGYSAGQIVSETYSGSGLLSGLSLTRSLDSLNRVQTLSASQYPTVTYGYDAASRLETLEQGNSTVSYEYNNALGRVREVTIETNNNQRYQQVLTHDNIGRIQRVETLGNPQQQHTLRDYQYNAANQRTHVTNELGQHWHYQYDALGQLVSAHKKEAENDLPGYAFGYSFDDIGNRIESMTNNRTTHYQSDALNRYSEREFPAAVDVRGLAPANVGVLVNSALAIRTDEAFYAEALFDNSESALAAEVVVKALDPGPPERLAQESRNATIAQSPEAYQYDLDGNLLQDGLWDYTWDGQNRLVAMETRADLDSAISRQRLEFTYDSQSRRIGKTVEQWNGTIWEQTSNHRYLYDGWNLVSEILNLPSEIETTKSFLWGLDLSGSMQGAGGVGGLLIASTDQGDHVPGYDANGNIITWVDLSDGSLAGTAEYSPFGEVLTSSGIANELSFGFSTKYTDAETGLLYYGFRYYDPETGRWPSRDPIEEQGGLNLYGFVGNDGVNQVDLLGLSEVVGTICCRQINVEDDDPWYVGSASRIFYHCDLEIGRFTCPGSTSESVSTYNVRIDRSDDRVDERKNCCNSVEIEDISSCAQRNFRHGQGWGNNCHTASMNQIGRCCLETDWTPAIYGGNQRGRCLRWEIRYIPFSGPQRTCAQWEFPNGFNSGIPGSCAN